MELIKFDNFLCDDEYSQSNKHIGYIKCDNYMESFDNTYNYVCSINDIKYMELLSNIVGLFIDDNVSEKEFTNVRMITINELNAKTIIDYSPLYPKLEYIFCIDVMDFTNIKRLLDANNRLESLRVRSLSKKINEDKLYCFIRMINPYIISGLKLYIDSSRNEKLFDRKNLNDIVLNKFKLIVKSNIWNIRKYQKFTISHMTIYITDIDDNKKSVNIKGYSNVEYLKIYIQADVPDCFECVNLSNFTNVKTLHVYDELYKQYKITYNITNMPNITTIIKDESSIINIDINNPDVKYIYVKKMEDKF